MMSGTSNPPFKILVRLRTAEYARWRVLARQRNKPLMRDRVGDGGMTATRRLHIEAVRTSICKNENF